jgi:hypothetical protein
MNFQIDDLCCVILVVGKVFWDINFGKNWDYCVWKKFFIKIYIGIAIIYFGVVF